MSRLSKVGLAILAVSVVGAAVNFWAREAYPTQWGGPNIGGGLLQLLFYAGALAGVIVVTVAFARRRSS